MRHAGLILLSGVFLLALPGAAAERVGLIRIEGAIGPATSDYLARAIDHAAAREHQCLIIQLDTPGGLLDSTKIIVQELLAAPLPTVVHVCPDGATAASAGCFITLAADVAAMAPATTIGAAHPVTLGGEAPGGTEAKPDDVMRKKLENYAASYIEAIAARRGRNVAWAREAVRDSASLTGPQALEQNVVELLARDLPELLERLDGRVVGARTLHTRGAEVESIPMTPRERAFQLLWRPEVLFLLMLLTVYGLIGELSNPGAILPGVVGAVALILALYLGAVLPVNLAGVALLVLAVVLFVADILAPTHGVLTVGGVVAFLLGALMLFDPSEPTFRLPLSLVLPSAVVTAVFFAGIVGAGLRAQFLPVRTGREAMIGRAAAVVAPVDAHGGKVLFDGEYWNAVSDVPIPAGGTAVVTGLTGLTLHVHPPGKDPP